MARPAIHPGVHLADELAANDMSGSQLATALGIPANRMTEILRGRRGISADTALRLAWWVGTTPGLWMNLQRNYALRRTQEEHGEAILRDVTPRDDVA